MKADIIKIGHHGAKDTINQKMIENLKPSFALISVGYNKFNHPHFETIEILNKNNIKIINTKNQGFSKINLDKNKTYYFNTKSNSLKEISFETNKDIIPFSESDFVKNFIKENI